MMCKLFAKQFQCDGNMALLFSSFSLSSLSTHLYCISLVNLKLKYSCRFMYDVYLYAFHKPRTLWMWKEWTCTVSHLLNFHREFLLMCLHLCVYTFALNFTEHCEKPKNVFQCNLPTNYCVRQQMSVKFINNSLQLAHYIQLVFDADSIAQQQPSTTKSLSLVCECVCYSSFVLFLESLILVHFRMQSFSMRMQTTHQRLCIVGKMPDILSFLIRTFFAHKTFLININEWKN